MKKFKIILPIAALAIAIITTIAVITAWYTPGDRVDDMSFNILQIDSLVTLYKANDSNYNGVPDLQTNQNKNKYYSPEADDNNGAYVSYDNMYHDENYSFDYVDQRYALSQDSKANLLSSVKIEDAVPSKIYGYKFEITNYVGEENEMEFSFVEDKDNKVDKTILKDFEVRLGIVNSNNTVTFTNWTSFSDGTTYSPFTLNPLNEAIKIPAQTGSLLVGRLDLWLQIKIKDEAINDNIKDFKLPLYRITLSCNMPDANNQNQGN